jgi:Histone deacetylase domain
MACTLHVAWDEQLTDYHFGPDHPLAPVRVELTMQLAHQFGLWDQPGVTMAAPDPAADTDLQLVHDAQYIAAVRAVSRTRTHPDASGPDQTLLQDAWIFGLGTEDNPVFPGMHEASALVAGATLAAARAVWSGSAEHGASIAGGQPSKSSRPRALAGRVALRPVSDVADAPSSRDRQLIPQPLPIAQQVPPDDGSVGDPVHVDPVITDPRPVGGRGQQPRRTRPPPRAPIHLTASSGLTSPSGTHQRTQSVIRLSIQVERQASIAGS